MVNTNTFLEERWSSLHSRGCGHPNMWHQSKHGRLLRKRLQNEFIQRQLRRERESRLENCIRQISKDCKEMLRKRMEEIKVYNSALPQTQSHKVLNKHKRYKCCGCRIRGHIINNCPNKGRRSETANTKVKEEKTDQKVYTQSLHPESIYMQTHFMIEGTDEGNWDISTSTRTLEGMEINIRIGREIFCIPGVQYTLDVTLNILSTDQLEAQGMDLAFKSNKCRLVYMLKDPENCKFDESKMKMMQNKYLSDYYKLLEENPVYEEGKSEQETILKQKCYRCEELDIMPMHV
nr:ARID DNA-binding domain-containing protein [Tanacetum cinerariifolium]